MTDSRHRAATQSASSRVVAIIDWRHGAQLKENIRFLERRGSEGAVRPRDWKAQVARCRSLMVHEDGSCLLQRPSAAAVARKLGGVKSMRSKREVGEEA